MEYKAEQLISDAYKQIVNETYQKHIYTFKLKLKNPKSSTPMIPGTMLDILKNFPSVTVELIERDFNDLKDDFELNGFEMKDITQTIIDSAA